MQLCLHLTVLVSFVVFKISMVSVEFESHNTTNLSLNVFVCQLCHVLCTMFPPYVKVFLHDNPIICKCFNLCDHCILYVILKIIPWYHAERKLDIFNIFCRTKYRFLLIFHPYLMRKTKSVITEHCKLVDMPYHQETSERNDGHFFIIIILITYSESFDNAQDHERAPQRKNIERKSTWNKRQSTSIQH